jgi:hypothetical protein
MNPFIQVKGWLDEPVRNHLRQDVSNADVNASRAAGGTVANSVEHFAAEREDIFRVAVHSATHLGQCEVTAGARKQRLA